MSATTVVNVLTQVWKILDDNTLLDVSAEKANAIPEGVNPLTDLAGGAGPNYFDWEWRGPGLIKADFWFHMRVNWMYGARYKGGGGFITACWPEVVGHNIWAPGYSIYITAKVRDVQNVGSEKAPIAQIALACAIRYHFISSALGDSGGTCNFELRGDGSGHAHWDDMSYDS
jgi:hypothetical protein